MSLRYVSQTCVINTGCRTFLHEYVVALIGGSFPMSAEFDIAIEYGGGGEALSTQTFLLFRKYEFGRRDQEAAVDQAELGRRLQSPG